MDTRYKAIFVSFMRIAVMIIIHLFHDIDYYRLVSFKMINNINKTEFKGFICRLCSLIRSRFRFSMYTSVISHRLSWHDPLNQTPSIDCAAMKIDCSSPDFNQVIEAPLNGSPVYLDTEFKISYWPSCGNNAVLTTIDNLVCRFINKQTITSPLSLCKLCRQISAQAVTQWFHGQAWLGHQLGEIMLYQP